MSMPIREIKGLPSGIEPKLKAMGIDNADELLAKAKTPADRRALAEKVGIDPKVMMELANRADLSRINGVAGAFSNLLEEAGVDTVKELAARVPENLQAKLLEVNTAKKISTRTPTVEQVTTWVAEAKALPKTLEY